MSRRAQPPYPPELRERAVRMVAEIAGDYESPWAVMNAVAEKLGVGTGETVRKWARQAEIGAPSSPSTVQIDPTPQRRPKLVWAACSSMIDRPHRRSCLARRAVRQ
jgi:transposase-like protein